MERRSFFKILGATSAGLAASGCGSKPGKLMPLLVPEHEIVPGEEQWHPAVCSACGAGCGTIVRVMEGERVVPGTSGNGGRELVRERVAAIKKIEGNPLDPVSGGRLCARGQAAVQSLYHPDRLKGPLQRSGRRGGAQFASVSWDEAIAVAAAKIGAARTKDPSSIVFLTGATAGSRSVAIERFMNALKAPPPVICSIAGHAIERKAAELVFGWKGLPLYDLSRARYVLSIGADFLGGWASPVYYARQYGQFRQGRKDVRGRLAHAESRLSLTASSADRWLPVKPGTEPMFAAAVGRLLLDSKLARGVANLPKPVHDTFAAADVKTLLALCGLDERRVREVAQDLGESEAPLVIGGASVVHANSLDAVVASHYLNVMLGSVARPGGILAPAAQPYAPPENNRAAEALARAKVVLVDGVNPVYTLPPSAGVIDSLNQADAVISFGSFLDDTAAYADVILASHDALESEMAIIPAVSEAPSVTAAVPFIRPLYDTRSVEQTLAELAGKLQAKYEPIPVHAFLELMASGDLPAERILRQGGAWAGAEGGAANTASAKRIKISAHPFSAAPPETGGSALFPLEFQPYLSLQYGDGSASHLPWMQELPDPSSSSIWGLPVEIDPKTAETLKIVNGDIVRVESAHGSFHAPAYIHPGAVPGVVSMPIGDGHAQFTRFATGRGANPISILAANFDKTTGVLVLGGTRVRVARAGGPQTWIQFSAPDREEHDNHR